MPANEPPIVGALITRVDRPLPALYALTLSFRGGSACLAIAAGPPRPTPALALLGERPRGEAADGEVRGLREKLESGRVSAITRAADRSWWELSVERGQHTWCVRVSARGLSVSPPSVRPTEAPSPTTSFDPGEIPVAEAASFVAEHRARLAQRLRADAIRSIERAQARLVRRRAAIDGDVDAMAAADEKAAFARLFVGPARAATGPVSELVATDWSSGQPVEVRFPLRGDRPPHAEVDAVFHHAKRLRRGLALADARAQEATSALDSLSAAVVRLEASEDPEAIARELARLQKVLPGDIRLQRARAEGTVGKRATPAARKSYRSFVSVTGAPLLVGKGGADNDALTLRTARPQDHFFHAKDAKGAHVIAVAPNKSAPLDARVLVEGALLAAHFSDRRGEAVVDVQHCARRHVRKRKGAPPGLVELSQEKVIAVRSDEAALARLLASEDRG